jgi:methionyl-tRNA formyltransferase
MKIVFMGTADFAVDSLEVLIKKYQVISVVTSLDNEKSSSKQNKFSPIKNFSLKNNLEVLQPKNLKDQNFINKIKELNPDLIVVVAFKILPKEIWEIPKKGTINLHASLLPDYRGAAPINWAIINGEKKTGLSTFFIDEKVDTGEIILQKEIEIENQENFSSLYDRMKKIGADLLLQTVQLLENGNFKCKIQKNIGSKKLAPKIFKEDCVINWNDKKENIVNFIRGLSDSPAAYTFYQKKIVKIFQAEVVNVSFDKILEEGEILTKDDKIFVGSFDGVLSILELQIEGKKKMKTKDFLSGNKIFGFFQNKEN